MRITILLSFVFLMSGCASLGDKFSQEKSISKGKALVYFYRVKRFMGSAGSPYVCLDGKVVSEAINGGYFPLEIKPGQHNIKIKTYNDKFGGVDFIVQKGKTYYFRYDVTMFNGVADSARAARGAGLQNGGGAIGAGMGAMFESSKGEIAKIAGSVDKRAQKTALNPGFLFVKPSVAKSEITKTKRFVAPKYSKNFCEKSK